MYPPHADVIPGATLYPLPMLPPPTFPSLGGSTKRDEKQSMRSEAEAAEEENLPTKSGGLLFDVENLPLTLKYCHSKLVPT